MSYTREIFRLAHNASLSLSVGRSPGLWRRELARSTMRLGLLGWASAWIEPLVAIELRLRDGPLLGRCIAELTVYKERAAQSDDSNRLPRRSIPGRASTGLTKLPGQDRRWKESQLAASDILRSRGVNEKMSAASNASHTSNSPSNSAGSTPPKLEPAQSDSRATVSSLAQLPSEASLSLLTRLVQDSSPLHRAEAKSEVLNGPSINREQTGARPSKRAGYDPVEKARQTNSHTNWQAGFSKRAEDALRRVAHRLSQSAERAELRLGPQLSLALTGQTAPQVLLTRLTSTTDSSRQARRASGDKPAINPSLSDAREKNANPMAARQQERITGQSVSNNELRQRADHSISARSMIEASNQEANSFSTGSGQTERIVLPVESPLLPPLTTPQSVGVEPIPVAATIATHQARAESAAADDDLDKLAAKIKLILDEQARRHGIDI